MEVPVVDQPGKDAGSGPAGRRGKSELFGIHVSVRPGSEGTRAEVPECVSVEEGGPTGAGEAACNDGQSSVFQAYSGVDWRAESAFEGMGELLFLWVPYERLLRDRTPCAGPSDPTSATPQPAAVSASRRGVLVAASGAVGLDPSIGTCACLRREFPGEPDAGNL